jgi:hypothetical protein
MMQYAFVVVTFFVVINKVLGPNGTFPIARFMNALRAIFFVVHVSGCAVWEVGHYRFLTVLIIGSPLIQ